MGIDQLTPATKPRRGGRRRCALCDTGRVPDDAYAQLFALYGSVGARRLRSHGAELVAGRHDLLGGPVDAHVIWAHFAQHDRRQPRPPGNLVRPKALAATDALSVRQREVLRMVGRLGLASAQHIWQALYEDQLASANAARATCYRELHPLIYGHWLYRARPPRSGGLRLRADARIDTLTFMHPGRQLTPMFERDEGYVPRIVTDARDVQEHDLRLTHAANGVLVGLRRELYGGGPKLGVPSDLRINPANWFGARQAAMRFDNPARGTTERVSPDGLAALSVLVPARGVDVLLPFYYLNDPGLTSPQALADQIVAYGALRLGGSAARHFPALGPCVPALLVVCESARRLAAVADAANARLASLAPLERPQVLVSDRTSMSGRAFSAPVLAPIDAAGRPEERITLLRGLLGAVGGAAREAGLRAATELTWRP